MIIKHPRNTEIDERAFAPQVNDPKALYGLPQTVEFCTNCVISNQRPNSSVEFKHTKADKKSTIHFDEDGLCDACRVAKTKEETDWAERERELMEVCDRHRKTDGSFDCLVPGSGGKDSFYTSHILKYKYGMNPLTVTWAPHIYTDWGWRNFQAWLHSGFDNYLQHPNPQVHRLLTRLAVDNLFHPFQPFILGQRQISPKFADLFDIPLVFYGEPHAEYGAPKEEFQEAVQSWEYFAGDDSNVYLGGETVASLKENFGLKPVDLHPYMPLDPQKIQDKGIEVHYLGYYLKWHPQSCYYYAVEHGGFEASPERTTGSYSKYSSIDDKMDDYHYYTTYIKFGIGRATYDAAQEVRSGDITRDEGIALIRRFDGEYPTRFMDECFKYMSIPENEFPIASKMFEQPIMDKEYFDALTDTFRSPHLWMQEDGEWKLRKAIFE